MTSREELILRTVEEASDAASEAKAAHLQLGRLNDAIEKARNTARLAEARERQARSTLDDLIAGAELVGPATKRWIRG